MRVLPPPSVAAPRRAALAPPLRAVVAVVTVAAVLWLGAGLAVAAATPAPAPVTSRVPSEEALHYDWHLGGFLGFMAGLFLPNDGEAVMSVAPAAEGEAAPVESEGQPRQLVTELLITSPEAAEGDHWRYGSRIEASNGHALEAWSSYQWKDKAKSDSDVIDEPAVLDVVSAIYAIRRRLPQRTTPLRVWSDGKIYPVEVVPRGFEQRKIGGQRLTTLHYTVRGDDHAEGRRWKGKLELWLARDAAATPVQIFIERSLANLRLEMTEPPPGA